MDLNAMARVVEAINTTKKILPDYWQKTLEQRTCHGRGSITNEEKASNLELALLEAAWEPYSHPAIGEGCTGFKTYDIKGLYGMDTIHNVRAELGGNFKLKVINPKGLKFSEVGFSSIRQPVKYTIIILGQEQGKEVVYTFHPGEPVKPDNALPSKDWNDGDTITIDAAIAYGVNWVKIL